MQLFGAIDITGGRLDRAVADSVSGSGAGSWDRGGAAALDLVMSWRRAGLLWLHLVDLDLAYGRGENHELIADLVARARTAGAKVQLSGGIRDATTLGAALATGADRVNLATAALNDLAWCGEALAQHGSRLSLSLDVVVPGGGGEPRLSARGGGGPDLPLWSTVERLTASGAGRVVVTDNSRDGQLSGPNLALLRQFRDRCGATEVIASGGVGSVADLRALSALGLAGVIVGRAFLDGALSLPEALAVVATVDGDRPPVQ